MFQNKSTFSIIMLCLFSVVVLLRSETAVAGWVKVNETARGIRYYDPTKTNRFGSKVETVILENFVTPEIGTKSIISDIEYSCETQTMRVLTIIRYPQSFGRGKVIDFQDINSGQWPTRMKVSQSSRIFNIVCGNYKERVDNQ